MGAFVVFAMALRIEWDKYEVALLIEACEKVLYKGQPKQEVVSSLSSALRTRALLSGIEIDDIFRNENGIYLQMTKMAYLLTDGKVGLPGASKLYVEIAELRKSNPIEYTRLLENARKQLGIKEAKVETNNKESFSQWLPPHLPKAYTIEIIISALQEGSDYCRTHGISKEDFWTITKKSKFTAVSSRLLSMRLFRLAHRKTAAVLDKAVLLYAEFLKTYEADKQKSDAIEQLDESSVPNLDSFRLDTKSVFELFYSLDDSEEMLRVKLDIVTSILKQRYSTKPAKTWKEVVDNNKDLPVYYINPLAQKLDHLTALQYLVANGIIQKPIDAMSEEERVNVKRDSLDRITQVLLTRVKERSILSLKELAEQNPDVSVTSVNGLAKELYGLTASEYLLKKGVLQPIPEKTEEEKAREAQEAREEKAKKLQQFTDTLNSRYATKPAHSLKELVEQNHDVSFASINSWARELYGLTASEYLIDKGILSIVVERTIDEKIQEAIDKIKSHFGSNRIHTLSEINACRLGISVTTLNNWVKSVSGKTLSDYLVEEGVLEREEPKHFNARDKYAVFFRKIENLNRNCQNNSDPICAEERSLIKVVEYLKSRYEVRLLYNSTKDDERHVLYMICKDDNDFMHVSYYHSTSTHLLSIATEPVFLEKMTGEFVGFTQVIHRTSHPCLKMVFEDYDSIEHTLVAICDAIDLYFSDTNQIEYIADRSKVYQKLYSISKVYDDPTGITVSKIVSLLGQEIDRKLIIDILDDVSWAVRISDESYCFSNKVIQEKKAQVVAPQSALSLPNTQDRERLINALLYRFRNGMQFDSIDLENFRETYKELYNEELPFDDSDLEEILRGCGVEYKNRLFPAEGIMDSEIKERLFSYIDNSFSSGKKVLYYKAIFTDLSDAFAGCYILTDEYMLRAYIDFVSPKGKYYFFSDYMSSEESVTVDHTAEVEALLLTAGKPVNTIEICKALSHIPKEQVIRVLTTDNRFLRNAKGEYFHVNIFEMSEDELENIAEIINTYILQNEYAIWVDVWNDIQNRMPAFLENNLYLSGLGIRNVLAQRFNGVFNFESAVISMPNKRYAMRDVFQLYAKHHSEFTADDIFNLSKVLDTGIYFDALAEVSVRVSHNLFVSKDRIQFEEDTVDRAFGTFISKDYIRLREIDSYLVFPNVGYEWNEYLLESFVYSYSKQYSLLSNGFSLHNVAGIVAKKTGSIREFVDACAAVLADAPIPLNKKDALDYLAEVNVITRRSYRDLDLAIRKAQQIRNRKG